MKKLLLLFVLMIASLYGQQQRSVSEILDKEGRIKAGTEGSFNAEGYNIDFGDNNEPLFRMDGDDYSASMFNYNWKYLTSGVRGAVHAIAVVGNDIYVGGRFNTAGEESVNNIAKWNGSRWSALGTGVNDDVRAIAVVGNDIYVGGWFTTAGGLTVNKIAKWDGNNWSALGTGVNASVYAVASAGSDVYVGGYFTTAGGVLASRIAKWNGSNWSALGTGVSGHVDAIAVAGSDVYAGGIFFTAGGITVYRIAKWDGSSWSALGFGVNFVVRAIAINGNDVYAGGSLGIHKWDGISWSTLEGLNQPVNAIVVHENEIYVGIGGQQSSTGGVRKWNGSVWTPVIDLSPVSHYIGALTLSGSDIYFGGLFIRANGKYANSIAKWNGSSVSAVGMGVDGPVDIITVLGSDVYVGGRFNSIGGISANRIAKWNGSSWSALGTGMEEPQAAVRAITIAGSDVYAGGSFTIAEGVTANNIAKWNGSNWLALGTGVNDTVDAIAVVSSDLYLGGNFTTAGGITVNGIAKWNGSSWSALGTGLNGTVNAIAVLGNDIYPGGNFTTAGGITVNRIARWNGSSWSALGTGVNGVVNAVAVAGGDVYIGGTFTYAGMIAANNIAKWDGNGWSALGLGLNRDVFAVAVSGSNVIVSGNFSKAGNVWTNDIAGWNGTNWFSLGSGFPNIKTISTADSEVWVGGDLNGNFLCKILRAPALVINSPSPGQIVFVNNTVNIAFDGFTAPNIKLEYTINGTAWNLISNSYPSINRIFNWTVPNSPSNIARIKISDVNNASINFISEAFIIAPNTQVPLIAPANNAQGLTIPVTFTWAPTGNDISYRLEFSTDSSFNNINFSEIIHGFEATLSNLSYNLHYFWRVRVESDTSLGPYSEVRNFYTAPIAIVNLTSPLNNSVNLNNNLLFQWQPVLYVDSYNLQVSQTSNFDSTVIDDYVTSTQTLAQLLFGKKYYWRVRGVHNTNPGPFSEISNFRTRVGTPLINFPANGSTSNALSTTFIWQQAEGAEKYHIQISSFSNFDSLFYFATDVTSTSTQVGGFEHNTQYYWRVRALNQYGIGDWSAVYSFIGLLPIRNIRFVSNSLILSLPCYINLMFNVLDQNNKGVTDIALQEFDFKENNQNISPSATRLQIGKADQLSYDFSTVLLLHNSAGVAVNNLHIVQQAAVNFVRNKLPDQKIAVYVFSEHPNLLQDFTTDTTALIAAINSIPLGSLSTNLYGSILTALSRWDDAYSTTEVKQGNLVLFYHREDNSGAFTLSQVLAARGNKRIVAVGYGNGLNPSIIEQIGNAGFYHISNINALNAHFVLIQQDLIGFKNSFYWMNYQTPARGDNNHTLTLSLHNNSNSGANNSITKTFNSNGFYSVWPGIAVRPTAQNPQGVNAITIPANSRDTVVIGTPFTFNSLPYQFQISKPSLLSIETIKERELFRFNGSATEGESTTVTISDVTNGFTKYLAVNFSAVVSVEPDGIIPEEFYVSQNYPNPFNPATTINYGIPEAAFVQIKIYNMLGEEIKTLLSEEKVAGSYAVIWSGDNEYGTKVTSGTYLYIIRTGDQVATKKMIMLK